MLDSCFDGPSILIESEYWYDRAASETLFGLWVTCPYDSFVGNEVKQSEGSEEKANTLDSTTNSIDRSSI